jgi:hypothetical protein
MPRTPSPEVTALSPEPLSSESPSPVPTHVVACTVDDVDSDLELRNGVVPEVDVERNASPVEVKCEAVTVVGEVASSGADSPQPVLYTLDEADLSALEGITSASASHVSSEAPSDAEKPKKKKSKHKDREREKDEKKRKKKASAPTFSVLNSIDYRREPGTGPLSLLLREHQLLIFD